MTTADVPYKFLSTAESPPRGSVTQTVTDQLRRAIVSLEIEPGAVLDKGAICERLGVSRFPVSEALARLAAEGLVEILPQRGSRVTKVRLADVVENMLIRRALESEAVRALVAMKPEGIGERLDANLNAQLKAAKAGDRDTFHRYDLEFHEILFTGLSFLRIKAVIDSARANLDRARLLILDPRRLSLTQSEHRAIADGVMRGDADAAAAAMRAHIDKVTGELLAFAPRHPELFADGDAVGADILALLRRTD
jgi:DNA-binding GntR family transcriptional regulator